MGAEGGLGWGSQDPLEGPMETGRQIREGLKSQGMANLPPTPTTPQNRADLLRTMIPLVRAEQSSFSWLQRGEDVAGERGKGQGSRAGEVRGTPQEGFRNLSAYHGILGT